MQLAYLGAVFALIVLLLALRRPLYQAILGGLVLCFVLNRMPFTAALQQISKVFTTWSSLSVLISLYLITCLQRMLEARQLIKSAQNDLDGLFHNRRINASGAPMFIGLLPSAAAMILCGDIVKDASDGYLSPKEQAFITSWFRHIPESSLPTYAGVLLMSNLSGVPLPGFMLGMIVPVVVLFLLGYIPYLRKIPKSSGPAGAEKRGKYALGLILHLWPLFLILVLILVFKLSVVPAVAVSIVLCALKYRFSPAELLKIIKSAFEPKLLLNTFLVLALKEFISWTGTLQALPEALSALPIPGELVFALMFLLGGIISGTTGIIALGTPMAFAAAPGNMPLMVLLMCMCHAASQISPTHVCLVVAADYYHIRLGELIRKSLPPALIFCALMYGYYLLMTLLKLG